MKRYTSCVENGFEVTEDPEGDYVAYADVKAMQQLLLDLCAWHENDDCPASASDQEEIMDKLIERAKQLTETSHNN